MNKKIVIEYSDHHNEQTFITFDSIDLAAEFVVRHEGKHLTKEEVIQEFRDGFGYDGCDSYTIVTKEDVSRRMADLEKLDLRTSKDLEEELGCE